MTMGLAQAELGSGADGKAALFATLAARFGERFSRSQALREQHANTPVSYTHLTLPTTPYV